ncbi:MAG: hypothetical protein FWC28_01205 [Proteobacteria bacterium]|nr:hypothetical protein [Pseudomonadota bacterium]
MRLALSAAEAGLAVTEPGGNEIPIPLSLNPMRVSQTQLRLLRQQTHHLMSAGLKMAYALHEGAPLQRIWRALSPFEKTLVFPRPVPVLATTRVDCWPSEGKLWALELNATIPAMQAYSDIAASCTIAAHGQCLHLCPSAIAKLQEDNLSNVRALWEALLAAYALYCPHRQPQRLGILCRRNDAQQTELRYLKRRFSSFGLETELLFPDQLQNKEGFWANGKLYDLVYRHLFIHRLEKEDTGHALLRRLLSQPYGPPSLVLNPPAAPVELKATLALLSESNENETLAQLAQLTPEERDTIAQRVPWTRLLDEKSVLERVQQQPELYVLKHGSSYGGKAVFIGKTRFEDSFALRCQQTFGMPLSWEDLCQRAFETGAYVAQQLVENLPRPHLLCTPNSASSRPLYVDFSLFSSAGMDTLPNWSGVCRASADRVVNILGGGGLVPLLLEEVAQHLQLGDLPYALDI